MSILNDTIKYLDKEGSGVHTRISSADTATDLAFVAGTHKRQAPLLLPALVVVVTGAVIYFLLPVPHPPAPAAVSVARIPPPVADPVPAVAQVTTAAPANVETEQQEMASSFSWYEAGWSAAHSGKWPEAFTSWENGLRELPKDRMVIVSNSYADLAYFSSVLDNYVKLFPTIGVRQQHSNGQTVYRLVVFPYPGAAREVFPEVQALFPRAGLVNASHVQIEGT